MAMGKNVTRLFKTFIPNNYRLFLEPNKKANTFSGKVVISGHKIGRPSKRLTFHQKGLNITKAQITTLDKKSNLDVPVIRINHQKTFDEVRLHSSNMLYPGRYTVTLEFSGKITRPMNGLYPCFFKHDNQDKQLLATQFESHHAREVFPCVDEPEAKATFDLSLSTEKNEEVIANTPIKKQTVQNDRLYTEFKTTPLMSTYLLAFATGELKHLESKTKRGVIVRTYATPDKVNETEFALDVGVKILEFYEEYFGIDYPLEKCDMVALPDFASGAMENWGLITYREQALLVNPDHTSLSSKQWVAMVVAHELAHQWFGNLVTMRWWTDLWLNEGFASWIEYLAVDHIFPEWEMWTQFDVDERHQALKLDALANTHPVEVAVNHPDEIRSIFDAISYSKGASVIHMLNKYLGPDDFQAGLRHYLKRHQYGNTDTIDLWQALEEISGKPVKDFMHAWTSQPGYPLITAKVSGEKIHLSQSKFIVNPLSKSDDSDMWPIALLDNDRTTPDQFTEKTTDYKIASLEGYFINQGQSGFYRTVYDVKHFKNLGTLVKQGKLSPLDRIGLLGDYFEASKAGQASTVDALQFIENYSEETNYAVWDVIAGIIGNIRAIFGDDKIRELMKPFVRKLIHSELNRLGWDTKADDSHFDRLLRPVILGLASSAEDPEIVSKCIELFNELVVPDDKSRNSSKQAQTNIKQAIDPDLRGVVFGTVARQNRSEDFDKLIQLHNSSTQSDERLSLSLAISSFKQPEIIDKGLAMIKSDAVRLQDVSYWIAYSLMNRHAQGKAWEWIKANWEWLDDNIGSDLSFYRMPMYVARAYSDEDFINEYKAFFKPRLNPAMERSYNQGIEMLEWQSAWKKREYDSVKMFFTVEGSRKP